MFEKVSEHKMTGVRWFVTVGWLLLILSLFYDPLSPWLTDPSNHWSPLRVDPSKCHQIQDKCYWDTGYPLGARFFWAAVVPSSIFILLTFSHELWRRICPLSFLSQLPAALKLQRRIVTSKGKREAAKVRKNSWLARNHLYMQFALLYLGLCVRILFINSDRTALASFLLFTIACAMAVGYWFGGKTWCHYFCPMAPVQTIFAEPGGLLSSKAHESAMPITQSMCRTITREGKEKSACNGCITTCLDIDSENSYWEKITSHDQKLIHYAYIGLVLGFYLYYFLYSGNWDYYFSAHWTHENQIATLWSPGFYLLGKVIPIPKIMAVPFTLGSFSIVSYFLGIRLEKAYKAYLYRTQQYRGLEQLQHQIFTVCTFIAFNLFFVFGGRPTILLLPLQVQYFYNGLIICVSSLWLHRTWGKSREQYNRETLKIRNYKLLKNFTPYLKQLLNNTSLEELDANEIYVLTKVLPRISKQIEIDLYRQILECCFDQSDKDDFLEHVRRLLSISPELRDLVNSEVKNNHLSPTQLRN
ncbi:MAG: hypothetical protein JO235_08225 [Chroococcidiopsidaceae cyanobacterium CP_BM_RX_35]|nr:hypothetical protein [Chroococcidiopsidaceae cyanobacterium CP_BM_RX_35]